MPPSVHPTTRVLPLTAGVENILPGKSLLHRRLPSRTRMQRTLPEEVAYQALAPLRAKPDTMLASSCIFQSSRTCG